MSGTVRGSFLAAVRILRAIAGSWFAVRRPNAAAVGASLGTLAGVALLVFASVALLGIEGTNYKVLVAVWLWALPVLAVGAIVGYGCGRAVGQLRRPAKAGD